MEQGVQVTDKKRILIMLLLTGCVCGAVCGAACVFFAWLTTLCDRVFHSHDRLLLLLPLTGIVVVWLYDYWRKGEDLSVNGMFRHMRGEQELSPWLMPLIAVSTCLAYLTGGSVGRVGSAVQIGGGLAVLLGRKFSVLRRFDPPADLLLACGIAAGFSGVLNAPCAGAVFGVEVLILRGRKLVYIIPAMISSFITWGIGNLFHVGYIDFHPDLPSVFGPEAGAAGIGLPLGKIILMAVAAMLAGRLYCFARRTTTRGFQLIGNRYLAVIAGTVMVIALTRILGHTNCNGIGFTHLDLALDGYGATLSFLWKLMLTVFTLGCGIRGGEIAPVMFIGATGCFALGSLIGLDPGVSASIGLVGALASVTNCPIALWIYGMEAISCTWEAALYFALAVCAAHFLSGTGGIYSEQHSEQQVLKPKVF